MLTEPRTEKVNFRMTPGEVRMLRELAEASGVSGSDVVRMLIRERHAEKFGDKPPKKPKR